MCAFDKEIIKFVFKSLEPVNTLWERTDFDILSFEL